LPSGERTNTGSLTLAKEIAQSYEKNGSPAQALPYLKLAAYWEKDPKRHAELAGHIEQLKAAQRLDEENTQRRPKIQRALNQSAVVRPRLTAADLNLTETP
jgi:hypothetical protein